MDDGMVDKVDIEKPQHITKIEKEIEWASLTPDEVADCLAFVLALKTGCIPAS